MNQHHYYVYILTNRHRTVLYTGVTNDLRRRVNEHKEKRVEGFTKRYNVETLVYFEYFRHIEEAIEREKKIKAGSRMKKEELINRMNPEWRDLSEEVD
jgi:putative endonuclease